MIVNTNTYAANASSSKELEDIKAKVHDISIKSGDVVIVGTLADLTKNSNWTGNISLARRLDSGELNDAEIQKLIKTLPLCFVQTTAGASMRCIDGRMLKDYDDNNPKSYGSKLGPEIPGGSVGVALAYRLAIGDSDSALKSTDLEEDLYIIQSPDFRHEYKPGGHTDDHHHPGKTGCGAIDGIEGHLVRISSASIEEIESLSKAILEKAFSSETFDYVIAATTRMLAHEQSYFKNKSEVLDAVCGLNPNGAEKLTGNHLEVVANINFVPNTTLHRDHLNTLMGGKLQVFNYDVWRTFDHAKKLFPKDAKLQSKYIHSRVALAISALMCLTDGSLKLTVRREPSKDPAA